MMSSDKYTAKLQAGLGLINDTLILLDLWNPGMNAAELMRRASESGSFASMTARRMRNVVMECFAPRYLVDDGAPAQLLKAVRSVVDRRVLEQLLFVYTCRSLLVLHDFVTRVYWPAYSSGRTTIANYHARDFIKQSVEEGRTTTIWSESVINSISSRLTGVCADFGLLDDGAKSERAISSFALHPDVALILAHEMHFAGVGDNALVAHRDWALFGLERFDVVDELKRQAVKGGLIVQSAGEAVSICWKHKDMKGLLDELA